MKVHTITEGSMESYGLRVCLHSAGTMLVIGQCSNLGPDKPTTEHIGLNRQEAERLYEILKEHLGK